MIAVYVKPETLTVGRYDKARKGLRGLWGKLWRGASITPVLGKTATSWSSRCRIAQGSYDAFGKLLMPVLQEVG